MRRSLLLIGASLTVPAACTTSPNGVDLASAQQQVMSTERAFAQTMAGRNHEAFASLLSEEAIFFSGDMPVRGKQSVAADWTRFFEGGGAPFSWEPDRVEVLDSGSLALSTGRIHDPTGKLIGRFNSIWRQEAPGQWRIILDKGSPVCPETLKAS